MPRFVADNITPLVKIRNNAGFSRENASSILNITMMTLTRYEMGKTDIPLGIAEDMASLYNVPFDSIREAARNTKSMKGVAPEGRITIGRKQKVQKAIQRMKEKTLETTGNLEESYTL